MKRLFAFVLAICMLTTAFAGCGQQAGTPTEPKADQASTNEVEKKDEKPAKDVDLTFFTGKVETVDLLDEIIADFNAQSGGITVEQEYQNDASNIIKIKFASGEAPDIMTTYEQEYVDQGKYLDLSDMDEIWNRLIPSMKESCTDINSGKQYRICTNMTMAGFFYNKEIFAELGIEPATTWEGFVANLEKIKTEMPDVDPWFIFGSEAWHSLPGKDAAGGQGRHRQDGCLRPHRHGFCRGHHRLPDHFHPAQHYLRGNLPVLLHLH